nr:CRISPR-associated endonuclease Cas1 [Nitrosomonas ureae]
MIEPLRPLIDSWVWQMFYDRHLRLEYFSDDNGRCVLHKAGRRHFYEFYESHCDAMRRLLRRYRYALVKQYQLVLDDK